MSKDQKNNFTIDVETVEKLLNYCITTMEFWKIDKEWPSNLIHDTLIEIRDFVSRSHINDK